MPKHWNNSNNDASNNTVVYCSVNGHIHYITEPITGQISKAEISRSSVQTPTVYAVSHRERERAAHMLNMQVTAPLLCSIEILN
jgi:hypothetical protein